MRGWYPNSDGVEDFEWRRIQEACNAGVCPDCGSPMENVGPRSQRCFTCHPGPDELTQPLSPDEERQWADECYDRACSCMGDIRRLQPCTCPNDCYHHGDLVRSELRQGRRVRTYRSLPESDLWRDDGAGG
jgi:hypothetical protein